MDPVVSPPARDTQAPAVPFAVGALAFEAGTPDHANPYPLASPSFFAFDAGWKAAQSAREAEVEDVVTSPDVHARLMAELEYCEANAPQTVGPPTLRAVTIPGRVEHQGYYSVRVLVAWTCPTCGGPRGDVEPGVSYDGSMRLGVDTWHNPCGHVDKFSDVRREAATNGLNDFYRARG